MKNYFFPVIIISLVLFYAFSSYEQIRFDLTNDKKYSLSNSSIEIIKNTIKLRE